MANKNNPTKEEKKINQINKLKESGEITRAEAKDLKDQVREAANKKGRLTEKELREINKEIRQDVKDKGTGKDDRNETPTKPGGSRPGGSGGPNKPGGGGANKPGGGTGGGEDSGGKKWDEFKSGYKELKNPEDKAFIRRIFGGAPQDDRLASWKVLSDKQKNALVDSIRDKVISDNERKYLRSLFKKEEPEGGKENGGVPEDGDIPEDGLGPSNDGGGEGDDEPASGGPNVPPVKGSKEPYKLPNNKPLTKYAINKKSEDRITMPNLDEKIFKEVQRITKNLISATKEFIEGGINYDGIDYIPDDGIFTDDGRDVFDFVDFNTPGDINSGLADETMAQISEVVQKILDQGDKERPRQYNYAKYLDLFELRYNNDGTPYYRFSLELVGELSDEITLKFIKNRSNETNDTGPI